MYNSLLRRHLETVEAELDALSRTVEDMSRPMMSTWRDCSETDETELERISTALGALRAMSRLVMETYFVE